MLLVSCKHSKSHNYNQSNTHTNLSHHLTSPHPTPLYHPPRSGQNKGPEPAGIVKITLKITQILPPPVLDPKRKDEYIKMFISRLHTRDLKNVEKLAALGDKNDPFLELDFGGGVWTAKTGTYLIITSTPLCLLVLVISRSKQPIPNAKTPTHSISKHSHPLALSTHPLTTNARSHPMGDRKCSLLPPPPPFQSTLNPLPTHN